MTKIFPLLLALGTLAACDRAPVVANDVTTNVATPVATPSPAAAPARPERDYLGRWVGVEGMYLDVAKRTGGGVTLTMQWDLDHTGRFDGSVTAEGLRFMRSGVAEVAVPGSGDATGLKWLAGKKDCLIVKPGEGYCRV